MKVCVFAPFSHWTYHFETDVEIALKHLHENDEVHFIRCDKELEACTQNPQKKNFLCAMCRSKSDYALNLIGLPKTHRHNLNYAPLVEGIPEFSSIAALKKYRWNKIEVGPAVASTLISIARDTKPDMTRFQGLIKKLIRNYVGTYQGFGETLDRVQPDVLYVFNGRFASLRAAVSAAKKRKIKVLFHERPMTHSYELSDGLGFHDLDYFKKSLKLVAKTMKTDRRSNKVAEGWFNQKRAGNDSGTYVFVKGGGNGLPEGFDPSKRNVAIFNNCEDEYIVFESWGKPLFKDQYSGIQKLISQAPKDFHFYLRVHPRLAEDNNTQTQQIASLNAPNLTVLPANEPYDSYALIDACEKVISFGSTIGIESVFWGTPSILLGPAKYESLNACHKPKTQKEFFSLLSRRLPKPKPVKALPWGYYMERGGQPFVHMKTHNPREKGYGGTYKGKVIRPTFWNRVAMRSLYFWDGLKKKSGS